MDIKNYEFNEDNTNGFYTSKQLEQMNKKLFELVQQDEYGDYDEQLIKHYSDKIIEEG